MRRYDPFDNLMEFVESTTHQQQFIQNVFEAKKKSDMKLNI